MTSHISLLALRPDAQFSDEIKTDDIPEPTSLSKNTRDPLSMASSSTASAEAAIEDARAHAAARLPAAVRLPLVCVLALGSSMFLNTLISEYTGLQLAAPSRYLIQNWQIAAVLGWRVTQIVLAWSAGYDWIDLTALTFLTNYPFYYLLNAFWSISHTAISISLAIDVLSISLPFAIFRASTHPRSNRTANQALAADWTIMALFAAQAVAIYATVFYLAYYLSGLSVFLITHFDVVSLSGAHDASFGGLLLHFAVIGLMAMIFLFQPGMAAPSRPSLTNVAAGDSSARAFDAVTATLRETVLYNLGFNTTGTKWSYRAEVLGKRIAMLVACVWANTAIRSFATVEGTDVAGAVGWGGLWTVANLGVGAAYLFLENEY